MDSTDSVATMTTCERGYVFYTPDETGEVIFLLKKGKVQLYRMSPEGRKLVIATLGPGSIFGEMSIVGQGVYDSFAEAIEDCTLHVMGSGDLKRILITQPQVGLRIVETLGQRLREVEARLEDITCKGLAARLASLLLRLQKEYGNPIEGYTHQDLADMIGMHRETTTQTLNDFKRDGLLDIGRKRLELYDLEGLRALAEQ
jgi:CRP-like cAMP-binding protein